MMSQLRELKKTVYQRGRDVAIISFAYLGAKFMESKEKTKYDMQKLNESFEKYERKGGLLTKGEYNEAIGTRVRQKMRDKIGELYEVDSRTLNKVVLHEIIDTILGRKRRGKELAFSDETHEMIAKIATVKGIPETETERERMHEEALLVIESIRN